MHAILNVPWEARPGNIIKSPDDIQTEGDDLSDLLDKVQQQIEKLYEKPVKSMISSLKIAVLEEGHPVKVEKLKDKFKIKVYLTVALENKPVRRKAKR